MNGRRPPAASRRGMARPIAVLEEIRYEANKLRQAAADAS